MADPAFTLTLPARRDLAAIWAWIAEQSGRARAGLMIQRIREACAVLADRPFAGRERAELRPGVRSFAVAPYVIFYEPADPGIRVLRVIHGARHLPRALRERPLDES